MMPTQPAPAYTPDLVDRVRRQVKRDFGTAAEPVMLHAPVPELLAGTWAALRETLVAGRVDRAVKEAVAATVSRINRCPYCVDAHTIMLSATGNAGTARLVNRGDSGRIPDRRLRAAVEWAEATRSPGAGVLQAPPFGREEAPEIIGTALLFHYTNRVVSIFLGDSPLPLPLPGGALRAGLDRLAGRYFRRVVRNEHPGGMALGLLPEAELPGDLGWADGSEEVAAAWACWAAVVEPAGESALAPEVRARVRERIGEWEGEDPGPGLRWIEDGLAGLDDELQPAGRLALMAAFAPYRVDGQVIGAYRDRGATQADVVAAASWAAFAAARRIGAWLPVPPA